jgi:hypothetical protein
MEKAVYNERTSTASNERTVKPMSNIKTRIAHAVINKSYDLGLPAHYHHDVAHDCIAIMGMESDTTPFVLTYRDRGTHVDFYAECLQSTLMVFGRNWPMFRFEYDAYEGIAKAISLTADEAEEYLSQKRLPVLTS